MPGLGHRYHVPHVKIGTLPISYSGGIRKLYIMVSYNYRI